jgi:hypothetical protein
VLGLGALGVLYVAVLAGFQILLKCALRIAFYLTYSKARAALSITIIVGAALAVSYGVVLAGILKDQHAYAVVIVRLILWFGAFLCTAMLLAFTHILRKGVRNWSLGFLVTAFLFLDLTCLNFALGGGVQFFSVIAPGLWSGGFAILIGIGGKLVISLNHKLDSRWGMPSRS